MPFLARATPLVVPLLATSFAATSCGHATDGSEATPKVVDCIVEHADGMLTSDDQSTLAANFQSWERPADPNSSVIDEDRARQTLDLFDYLDPFAPDDAATLSSAASTCGVDFQAMVANEASDQIPDAVAGTPQAAACVARAATEDNVREYVVAVFAGEETTYRSRWALWRTLDACTPRQTLATAPDTSADTDAGTDTGANDTEDQDNNGYFDDDTNVVAPPSTDSSVGGQSDIERCLDSVDDQAGEIVLMLNEGLITEADYERLMAENSEQSQNCLDLR